MTLAEKFQTAYVDILPSSRQSITPHHVGCAQRLPSQEQSVMEGGEDTKNFTVEAPDTHHLSSVLKVNVNSDLNILSW